jgi:hypothetical protein
MPWVGFEPTVPASERAKTGHGLDRSATVTDTTGFNMQKFRIMHTECICVFGLSEGTAVICLDCFNRLALVMVTVFCFCGVRTGFLNKIYMNVLIATAFV